MNDSVIKKINKIKIILDENDDYIDIASIEEKQDEEFIHEIEETLSDFYFLKSKYEDMWFGSVNLWVDNDIFEEHQIYIMIYEVLDGNNWICIGEVEPYPIILNKKTGIVNCIISEPGFKCELKPYAKFDIFINEYILGEKYLELVGNDEWYDFMKKYKIV